ncbi:MAG: hypothetical protein EBZ55_01245 [Actinobacteria bacterium]|nr:hypothetical protein [Actinomycetota bacterium]
MGRRRTVREEIAELERDGTLNAQQASTLRDAPRWSIEANELFAYLGGLIAAIGVTWLTIALVQDTSPLGIRVDCHRTLHRTRLHRCASYSIRWNPGLRHCN